MRTNSRHDFPFTGRQRRPLRHVTERSYGTCLADGPRGVHVTNDVRDACRQGIRLGMVAPLVRKRYESERERGPRTQWAHLRPEPQPPAVGLAGADPDGYATP